MEEKRKSERLYLRRTIIYGMSDPPGFIAFAKDISKRGMLIASRHMLGEGTRLHFSLRDEENRFYKAEGVVVRIDEKSHAIDMGGRYQMGIEFIDMSEGMERLYSNRSAPSV